MTVMSFSSNLKIKVDFEALQQLVAAVTIFLEDAAKSAAERHTKDFSSICT